MGAWLDRRSNRGDLFTLVHLRLQRIYLQLGDFLLVSRHDLPNSGIKGLSGRIVVSVYQLQVLLERSVQLGAGFSLLLVDDGVDLLLVCCLGLSELGVTRFGIVIFVPAKRGCHWLMLVGTDDVNR